MLPSAQQPQVNTQVKPKAKPQARRPFDPPPKPKTAAKPPPKPKPQPRPKIAFGSKPKLPSAKPLEPKTIFGPKIKTARVNLAKKIATVRKQYIAGANRRNTAAIKVGIKARAQGGAPADMVGAPTSAPPTEAILKAIVALNEALLAPAQVPAAQDAQYQTHCSRARLAESLEWKIQHHQHASNRANELGCVELAERHQLIAETFLTLAG